MANRGLRTFSLHRDDDNAEPVVTAVGNEIRAAAPEALPFDATAMDAESAAKRYLLQALASESVPTLELNENVQANNEFRSLGTEVMPLTGTTIVKFRQWYSKIPIYGSLVTVELGDDNELLAINTALGEPANVDPVARISPAQALQVVRRDAGYKSQPLNAVPRQYCYFDDKVDRWRLVYIFEDVLRLKSDRRGRDINALPQVFDYVIDAHNGDLVATLPRTQTVSWNPAQEANAKDGLGRNRTVGVQVSVPSTPPSRRLFDQQRNVRTHDLKFRNWRDARFDPTLLPGAFVTSPPDPWDPSAVSAHANAEAVADFFSGVLRRNGLDNAGGPYVSSINVTSRTPGSSGSGNREWRNAAWIGTQMIYGQRLVGSQMRSYALADDVVAHEITHGLTDRTARLEYESESGALNESYSDIFGTIVSNYGRPNIGTWNWQMGEDLDGTGIPIRDMSDPSRFGQPAHMNNYQQLPPDANHDYGGVHINSGIHNKAAYDLMTTKRSNGEYLFTPVQTATLFYVALTQYLGRTSGFTDSRRAVRLVGRSLFRNLPTNQRQARNSAIDKAFDAVGIAP